MERDESIAHYLDLFARLQGADWSIVENLGWMVIRPQTVDEVIRRLGGEPASVTGIVPADTGYDDEIVYVDQRGDAVMVLDYAGYVSEEAALRRLSAGATVHGVHWGITNHSRLFRAVDGVVVTELDTLEPSGRWGADPEALTAHLGPLIDLHETDRPGDGIDRDWPTAMAVVAGLTGLDLDADWFRRPQRYLTLRGALT